MIEWDYRYIPVDPDKGEIMEEKRSPQNLETALSDMRTEGWHLVKIIESRTSKHWVIVKKARWAHQVS